MKPAYIHVALCDHDFAQHVEGATIKVYDSLKNEHPAPVFKQCVIDLTIAYCSLWHAALRRSFSADTLRAYLDSSLEVIYAQAPPTDDHDGASVAINTYTSYIWRY
jgi:hypothetical protein